MQAISSIYRTTRTRGTVGPTNVLELWGVGTHLYVLQETTEIKRIQRAGKRGTLGALSLPSEGKQEACNQNPHVVPAVPTFSIYSQSDYVLQGLVNGVAIDVLVDTGAAATVLSRDAWGKVCTGGKLSSTKRKLVGIQGTPLQLHGESNLELTLGGHVFPTEVTVADSLTTDLILGRHFLKAQRCTIRMGNPQGCFVTGFGNTSHKQEC